MKPSGEKLRVAILNLYDGAANQGMRCIREILRRYAVFNRLELEVKEFEVRKKLQMADTSFHVYISTGGPGSPLESRGSAWEHLYFSLIRDLEEFNTQEGKRKKHVLFICHSFQLMCRYYGLGEVCKRKSPSYGVFPVHKTTEGMGEILFRELPEPFFAVESREWQVIAPDPARLAATGSSVLAIEKERPHVPMERALMAVRFNACFFGTQFHPEADPVGMVRYLQQEEKKDQVIRDLGVGKYERMLEQLHDPDKIMLTQNILIPAFLDHAVLPLDVAGKQP